MLDRKQTANGLAEKRHDNYKKQPIEMKFNESFTGKLQQYGLNPNRWKDNDTTTHQTHRKPKAAIIREKGTNGDREMAYSLYLAGFEVKDVTMTDLISGRETLEEMNMIVFCGGFSNSDVLGSAKGWQVLSSIILRLSRHLTTSMHAKIRCRSASVTVVS